MIKNSAISRLKKVILCDKVNISNGLLKIIEKDTFSVLNEYFCVIPDTVKISVEEKNGIYEIRLQASAESIKPPSLLK